MRDQPEALLALRLGHARAVAIAPVLADQPATAEVGVTLAPERQSAGLATEALGAIVSTLFEDYHMHRVFGEVDDRNTPVQNVFGRLGFRCEARQLEADWFTGEWTTVRVYAMLEHEWRAWW